MVTKQQRSYIYSMAVPATLRQSLPDKTMLPPQGPVTLHPSSPATLPPAYLHWMTFWTSTNPTHSRIPTPHKARMSPRKRLIIMTQNTQTCCNQSRRPRIRKGKMSPRLRITKTKLFAQTSSYVPSPNQKYTMMICRTTRAMKLKNTSTNRYSQNLLSIQ